MYGLIVAVLFLTSAAAAAAPSADTALAKEWDAHLRGKRLTQMESYSSGSGGGYNSTDIIYLCAEGSFINDRSSSVSVYGDLGGMGSAGGTERNTGRWRVVSEGDFAALEIQIDGGASGYLALSYANGATYVGGSRAFVTDDNDAC